ncbi:hypothetical protein [Arsenophonus sp. ENCA]|uniref:hypothetical protein n=1 Tax=Arsenophonus sp. ENCA TaxID=1987579 RepID=UPI0025B89B60|nr:hypothetical protein [Arsenophonus sp. ENCA]
MIPSYSLAQVFGISISEQRKIYFNHRNTLISLLSNTLNVYVKSERAGKRVKKNITRWLDKKLKLRVTRVSHQ